MALNFVFDIKWVVIPIVVAAGLAVFNIHQCRNNDKLDTYNRQLSGQLTEKERKLQEFNKELGIAKSELVTHKELVDRLKYDNEEISDAFDKFIEEHDLQIKSRDVTIASLRRKLKNGISAVDVGEFCNQIGDKCVISYSWHDDLNRFSLVDPNIFKPGDEVFTTNQFFKIYGTIWKQKSGFLETRKLTLKELYKDTDGTYKEVPDAEAEILDSNFVYDSAPVITEEWEWTDLFTLRPVFLASVKFLPNTGDVEYGAGIEIIGYRPWGLGLNTHTSLNFNHPEEIGQYIGISYTPMFFDIPVNFGLSLSVGTPFVKFGQVVSFKVGALFYLW